MIPAGDIPQTATGWPVSLTVGCACRWCWLRPATRRHHPLLVTFPGRRRSPRESRSPGGNFRQTGTAYPAPTTVGCQRRGTPYQAANESLRESRINTISAARGHDKCRSHQQLPIPAAQPVLSNRSGVGLVYVISVSLGVFWVPLIARWWRPQRAVVGSLAGGSC